MNFAEAKPKEPIAPRQMTVPPKRRDVHPRCKIIPINRDHLVLARFCTRDHEYDIISKSIADFYRDHLQESSSDGAVIKGQFSKSQR